MMKTKILTLCAFIFSAWGCTPSEGIDTYYAIGDKAFNEKLESFMLTPDDAFKIISRWEEKNEPKIFSWEEPQLIVGDYYFFPPWEKVLKSLTGYYVHGNTGTLEFRTADETIMRGGFFYGHPKVLSDIFTNIEILKEGNTKNSQ